MKALAPEDAAMSQAQTFTPRVRSQTAPALISCSHLAIYLAVFENLSAPFASTHCVLSMGTVSLWDFFFLFIDGASSFQLSR